MKNYFERDQIWVGIESNSIQNYSDQDFAQGTV